MMIKKTLLVMFLLGVYSFPIFEDSSDYTESFNKGNCADQKPTFSAKVPYYGTSSKTMLMSYYGGVSTGSCNSGKTPFFTPYLHQTGYNSGLYYLKNNF